MPMVPDAGTADLQPAAPVGSPVALVATDSFGGPCPSGCMIWRAGSYAGPSTGGRTDTDPLNLTPWVAPVAGTLAGFVAQSSTRTQSALAVTAYRSQGGHVLGYVETPIKLPFPTGAMAASDLERELRVERGDCLLFRIDQEWQLQGGFFLTALFVPTPPKAPTNPTDS